MARESEVPMSDFDDFVEQMLSPRVGRRPSVQAQVDAPPAPYRAPRRPSFKLRAPRTEPEVETATKTFRIPVPPLRPVGLDEMIARIAKMHGVTPEHVWSRDRARWATRARHHVWTVTRWTLGMSYPEMGELFGFDHSTIVSAVNAFDEKWAVLP